MPRPSRRLTVEGEAVYVAGTGTLAADVTEYADAAGFRVVGRVELLDPERIGSHVQASRSLALRPCRRAGAVR